jgi:hypothetical protein
MAGNGSFKKWFTGLAEVRVIADLKALGASVKRKYPSLSKLRHNGNCYEFSTKYGRGYLDVLGQYRGGQHSLRYTIYAHGCLWTIASVGSSDLGWLTDYLDYLANYVVPKVVKLPYDKWPVALNAAKEYYYKRHPAPAG